VALAWYDTISLNLSEGRGAERINGLQVSHDFPKVLGVQPILGRTFTPEEDRPGAPAVVVLGERLWRERFGADPRVIGRTLRLQSTPYTIIGVAPRETEIPDDGRLWVARRGDPNQGYQSYGGAVLGRLKPDVTIAEATADLLRAQQPIWEARDKERIVSPFVRDIRRELTRDFRTASAALLGAVGLLLLVACTNVASVMLARALARRKEMAIRLAMGASRLRLLRQLLVENLLLSLVGGAIGVVLGRSAISALLAAVPDEAPQWTQFGLDARVVGFAVLASIATTILFGWAPALHTFSSSLQSAVHDTTKGATTSPRGRRTLRLLVGAECALAALLLVCGGLLAIVAVGVAVGLGASLLTGRLLDSLLFGVRPHDAVVMGGAAALLIAAALAANYWPARRAARVDPMAALRTE
jgi:putative ABC transport system permease protein